MLQGKGKENQPTFNQKKQKRKAYLTKPKKPLEASGVNMTIASYTKVGFSTKRGTSKHKSQSSYGKPLYANIFRFQLDARSPWQRLPSL